MVKVIQPDVPPEWEELWAKIVRWFDRYGVPTYARKWFQNYRRMTNQRYRQSKFRTAAGDWNTLTPSQKVDWDNAAEQAYGYRRGYRLFSADWIYRNKTGLSTPGFPSTLHQLFGLEILNPGASLNVYMRRDDKDLIGQIRVQFNFKKVEKVASPTFAFKMQTTAWYFIQGGYNTDTDEYSAPAGNIDWTAIDRSFGTVDRDYFHFKIVFTIENYDAEVHLDNVILSDKNGEFFTEKWNTKNYKPWVPAMLYRKRDWVFSPGYSDTYFKHLYLV